MESSAEPMSSCLVGFLSQSHTWLGLGLGLGPGLGLELELGEVHPNPSTPRFARSELRVARAARSRSPS